MLAIFQGSRSAVLALIIIGAGLSLLLPIRMDLRFSRRANAITIRAVVWFWIIPLRLNLVNPVTGFFWNLSVRKPWRRQAPQDLAGCRVAWLSFLRRSLAFSRLAGKVAGRAQRIFRRINRQICVERLSVAAAIGWYDAACTGILVGLGWSLLGSAYVLMTDKFNMLRSKNSFLLAPRFQKESCFEIEATCIFAFRLGHIIIVIYQILQSAGALYNIIRRASI